MPHENSLATVVAVISSRYAHATWEFVFLLLAGLLLLRLCYISYKNHVNVPSYGVPWYPLGSWVAAFQFITTSNKLIKGGYLKHHENNQAFKIATPSRWVVVTTSPVVLQQLSCADPTLLSQQAAANDRNSIGYTLSAAIHSDPIHVPLITRHLSINLSRVIPELVDGLMTSFRAPDCSEWTRVDIHQLLLHSLSATTNRILVGKDLAEDEEYLHSVAELAEIVARAGLVIDLAPQTLKQLLAWLLVPRNRGPMKIFLEKVGPLFVARRKKLQDLGEVWKDRPNDAVQWILEAAPADTSIYDLSVRILYLDFSAIHTTYVSIVNALYDLCAHPQFQQPLREEVAVCLKEHDGRWCREAFAKMKKLDSALRESQRLRPVTTATMMRRAQRPVTLADDTHLPVGQWIVAPAWAYNHMPASGGTEYDAFRHVDSRRGGDLSFGIGRQACPGRFFAQTELKILLAWVLAEYEFKLDSETQERPENGFFSFSCLPDAKQEILLKRR